MSYSSNTSKYKKSDVYKFNVNDNSNYERTGFLEITVTDAQTGMPIENVDIEVFKMTIMGEYAERAEEAI
jgi:hypothetical protein